LSSPFCSKVINSIQKKDIHLGPNGYYVIHFVTDGESVDRLAIIYDSTPDVIKKINFLPYQLTLWKDMEIILIPGEKNINHVKALKGVYIDHDVKVAEFLKLYKVSEAWFRINNLINGDLIKTGKWVIIEVER
jgi:hypothetical protein